MRQKRVVAKILENGGIVSKAMRDSNYSKNTAKTPSKLTNSIGFKEEMAKHGLTEELISVSLVKDIKAKPRRRVAELGLGAKILKMTDDTPIDNRVLVINITDEKARRIRERGSAAVREG